MTEKRRRSDNGARNSGPAGKGEEVVPARCKRRSDESPSVDLFSSLLLLDGTFAFAVDSSGHTLPVCRCGRFLFRLVHHRPDRPVSGQSNSATASRLAASSSFTSSAVSSTVALSSVSVSRFDHELPVDRLHYHRLVSVTR